MTKFATQDTRYIRQFQHVDTSKEPFEYETLELSFKYDPVVQQVYIDNNLQLPLFKMHAHPQLCTQHPDGYWLWDVSLADSYIFVWVIQNRESLSVDLQMAIDLWVSKS